MEKHAAATELRKNAVVLLFFQSLIAAALFPIVLGRGDTLIVVVWRLSLLLFSYFYSAVCVLSTATTRKARILVHLTYPALLAFVVDAVLSPAAGCAIMYLDSVWIACVFGRALAERSASAKSTAAAAAAAAAENPAPAQEADEKLDLELPVIVFIAVATSIYPIILAACLMDEWDYTLVFLVVLLLTAILCISLPIAIICTLKPLRLGGLVVLGEECGTGNVLACWYLSAFLLLTWSFISLSEVAAVVVGWICVLGLAVFFGYCLRLHEYYVDIMSSKQEMVAPPADDVDKNQAAGGNKEQLLGSYDKID